MARRAVVRSAAAVALSSCADVLFELPVSSLGATGTKTDRKPAVTAQTLVYVRQLLVELGSKRGLEELGARGPKAHLERELGLGSLERVELMLRLGDASGVRLPDRVVAEADTVQDLVDAILREETGTTEMAPALAARRPCLLRSHLYAHFICAASAAPAIHPDLEQQIRHAETLTEILRLRGRGEPGRAIFISTKKTSSCARSRSASLYESVIRGSGELRRRGLEPGQTVAIMLPTCADFFWTLQASCWPAEFRYRFIRHFARTASRNTPRGNRTSCATRKRNFCLPGGKPKGWLGSLSRESHRCARCSMRKRWRASDESRSSPLSPTIGAPVENLIASRALAKTLRFCNTPPAQPVIQKAWC